jgi:hypothetical protein
MRDPELVARAQRAATRLESAWEQWRALHGLAVAPAQPVVSYVGYSLNEPWGEPRVVIGIDADEAEFLADFLDRDECALAPPQPNPHQGTLLADPSQPPDGEYTSAALLGAPIGQGQLGPGQLGQVQLGQVQLGQVQLGQVQLGQGPHGGPGPLPLGLRRPVVAPADMELAGWQSGELPGQASEQLG